MFASVIIVLFLGDEALFSSEKEALLWSSSGEPF